MIIPLGLRGKRREGGGGVGGGGGRGGSGGNSERRMVKNIKRCIEESVGPT